MQRQVVKMLCIRVANRIKGVANRIKGVANLILSDVHPAIGRRDDFPLLIGKTGKLGTFDEASGRWQVQIPDSGHGP